MSGLYLHSRLSPLPTLIHGCHRPPAGTTSPLFPSSMAMHETPISFYTRVFLHSLRLPSLQLLGLPSDDILAIEDALKQALLPLPLPQALDVLHTQLLSCMCVYLPPEENPRLLTLTKLLSLLPVTSALWMGAAPPVFRCWIGRKVSPNMAVLDFKCDSLPWAASYLKGTTGRSLFGLSPGNFIQLVFHTTETFISDSPYFGLALYLTSVTTKGRVVEEHPEEQTDSGGSQVTQFSGILLPFLLKSTTQSGTLINQMHLPLFAKREQLHELVTFPPLDLDRTFYMPLSAPRGILTELQQVPFYRIPKTLGWPFLGSPMPPYTPPAVSLQPLHNLLSVLPFFFPSQIRSQIPPEYHDALHPWKYSLQALNNQQVFSLALNLIICTTPTLGPLIGPHALSFFFSNAALLKTVAVMSLLKLSQKRSRQLLPWKTRPQQNSPNQSNTHNTQNRGAAAANVT